MYLTRTMITSIHRYHADQHSTLIIFTWRSTQDEDLAQNERALQGSNIYLSFHLVHSKQPRFPLSFLPNLSHRRNRKSTQQQREATSEPKQIAILLPLSNTYPTVLNPFPDFNRILNHCNLANFLTILLKPLCTISNVFQENCGQFLIPTKPTPPFFFLTILRSSLKSLRE